MTTLTNTTLLAASLLAFSACASGAIEHDESVVGTWELRDADGAMIEQMQLTPDGSIAIDSGDLSIGSYEADGNVMRLDFDWLGGTTSYEFTYAATTDSLARIALVSWDGDANPVGRYSGTYRITSHADGANAATVVHFDYELELEDGGRAILLTTTNMDAAPGALIGSWSQREGGGIELLGTDGVAFDLEVLPSGDLGLTGIDGWGTAFGVFKRAR
jgi:hypothetical protein